MLRGTLGVTTIAFSLEDVFRTQKIVARTIFRAVPDPQKTARKMMEFALMARQRGHLSIEDKVEDEISNPIGHTALRMVVDGQSPEEIEEVLKREIEEMTMRHDTGAGILRKAAETAPAMGLIGTLIGLVQMLGNLDDPARLDRPEHGHRASDDVLRGRSVEHVFRPAGIKAGTQFRQGGFERAGLHVRRRRDQPERQSATTGSVVERASAARETHFIVRLKTGREIL